MKETLLEKIQKLDLNFNNIPRRIFLDTNVLQYIQDFGEYIFDNYCENEEYLVSPKKSIITKKDPLFAQIIALHDLFNGRGRDFFELALSDTVYEEVIKRKHKDFLSWFFEIWDYWQTTLESYKSQPITQQATQRYNIARNDHSLLGNLSKLDKKIVLDAINLDCDALLTVDKFAKGNFQLFVFEKYKLMVLRPTDLIEIILPYQALF